MTEEESVAHETLKRELVREQHENVRLRQQLKQAQGDEIHWREYFIAAGNGDLANDMLAAHHARWRNK